MRRLSCAFHRSLLQSAGIIVFVQSMPSCCPNKPHKLGFTAVLAVPDFGVRIFLSVVLVMLFQVSGEHCDNPLKSTFCENHKWFCYFILFFVLSVWFVCLFVFAVLFLVLLEIFKPIYQLLKRSSVHEKYSTSLIISEAWIKPQWHITSHLLRWQLFKKKEITIAKDVEKLKPLYTIGVNDDTATMETVWR